ncbi:hypothetical protein HCN44_006136 [Aphidius gifuensis]|uniref:C2H2-type domain-containing protein n=2 Tax=Aphidius gifuensis TaxID=684658 RepID=A0A835CYE7_APHGI|nr:zinc finger protein 385B-like isoform X2 [Aphidius gifuensis]KAF7997565.1 hypothetical protein HCN44_006136 [Aphidius gifuensis]
MATATHHPIMDASHKNPVIKEADNIESLSTNKALVRCNDCNQFFTSQTVLAAHLQGSRHAKQVRSKVIMASLEEQNFVPFTKNEEKNSLDCRVCNVSVNSIQQLQTHLNGSRHKKKATKGGWNDDELSQDDSSLVASSNNPLMPRTTNRIITLNCELCNKMFNSEAQYEVHTVSRRHVQRLKKNNNKSRKKRFFPYQKKLRSDDRMNMYKKPSLHGHFVSGGFNNNNHC